ncbi:PAS domain-containing protein [Pyxidicoccus sp. 3LFB2]
MVDDSPLEARRVREVLEGSYAVAVFTDAATLLEGLIHREALPHLVLLDWHMPGVSGLEALTFLRERYDEVTLPVLVLTASRREEDLEAALSAGANDFLPKPFRDAELRARVRTLVRVRQLTSTLRQREAEARAALLDARAARNVSASALRDVQDVTGALRDSEERLRESEERLRLTLTGTGMGTFELDVATDVMTFDARMREVCNLSPDEPVSAERTLTQVHPAERPLMAEAFSQTLEHGIPYRVEHRVIPRPGQQGDRWVAASAAAILGADGRVVRVVGTGQDITEQVAARQQLEESEARFRLIANALPQIVWTATAELFVDWYNDWWFKYLGLPRGTRWDDTDTLPMHPDDVERTRVRVREAVESGQDFLMEQRFRRGSDNQYRWHLVRGVPIRDADGRIVKWVGANTDIHDQKSLTSRLEEERELREKFVATLSHDLRTPLTAARLNAQMLARKGSDPTILVRSTARITENLDRVDQMIRDMLDANRIRAGEGLPIEVSECDLTPLARDTLEELALVHGDRFVLNAPGAVPGYWSCDGMRRILENLCNNAIKYGAREQPVTVTLAQAGPDTVSVSVHNWGPSIAPEDLKHLFQVYRRADVARAGPDKGWGLGLTVVEGLARAHRGSVKVQSAPETGTTFTVTLARDLRQ